MHAALRDFREFESSSQIFDRSPFKQTLDSLGSRSPGFEVDHLLRAVRYNGQVITLAPRSFALVVYLSKHAERVVGKEEILANIWPPGATEQSLRQEVYSLRQQLAKHGASSCVVTISQFGYRYEPNPRGGRATQAQPSNLTNYEHRALAATSFFEMKCDSLGWKRALFWYERLSRTSPQLFDAHIGAVRAALRLVIRSAVSPREALSIAERHLEAADALRNDGTESGTLRIVTDGLLLKRLERAINRLQDICAREPGNFDAFHFLAILRLVQSEIPEALSSQQRAMLAAPRSLESHVQYGYLLLFSEDYEAARNEFSFITNLQPDNVDAAEGLAAALLLLGMPDQAIKHLNSATWSVPTTTMLCVALARHGEIEPARKLLLELQELRRTTYVSGLHLARCYFALGDEYSAARALKEAQDEPLAMCAHADPLLKPLRKQ